MAKNWSNYSATPLNIYVSNFYKLLENNYDLLTPRIQKMMPSMIKQNWLLSYATLEGIGTILYQMDYRTKFKSKMQYSIEELVQFYTDFENEFTLFFEEIRTHSQNKLNELNGI